MTGACRRALSACAACATILVTAAAAEEPDFFVRLNRAREAVSSGAGRRYFDGPFSKVFYGQHPDLTRDDVFPPPPAAGLWVPVSVRISEE